jgi:hypothetical protein
VASHSGGHLVAERAEPRRQLRGGLLLLEGQLGIPVQVDVKRLERRVDFVDGSERRVGRAGGGEREDERKGANAILRGIPRTR